MTFDEFQKVIEATYGARDGARPVTTNFTWLVEEVGELAKALRKCERAELLHEFSDVLAWTATVASQLGIRLEDAIQRYAEGCPKCHESPCNCPNTNREAK
jgi:NTP pyrophosphatase (non-canonical NTP hydrolase)